MNGDFQEIQKIRNQILANSPTNVKDFVDLFFRMYESDSSVDLINFISVIREMQLKVVVAGIQYELDKSGLKTLLERRVSEIEFKRDFERASTKYPNFPQSEAYIYIKQFVRKYGNDISDGDVSNLKLLLKNRGWNFSSGELSFFLGEENRKQFSDAVKSRILRDNPQSRQEILKSYLNYFSKC